MAIRSKTYLYRTAVEWAGEKRGKAASEGKPEIEVATPPEFRGHAGIWSPEDLFVSAVNVCVMTTFLSMVDREGLALGHYRSEAEGKLELTETGFMFTEIVVRPEIGVSSEEDIVKASALIGKAEHACLISNSIRSKVILEPRIALGTQASAD